MIAWTIYITFAGAFGLLFMPRFFARWIALAAALAGFATSLLAFCNTHDTRTFVTIVRVPWVPALGMEYHLAVDGISLTLAVVTGLTAVSAVLFSWDVE
ncbi:MAG: NADH-quinone oxidoreductase subunit, partial [Verrucomicrobiota bacterium]